MPVKSKVSVIVMFAASLKLFPVVKRLNPLAESPGLPVSTIFLSPAPYCSGASPLSVALKLVTTEGLVKLPGPVITTEAAGAGLGKWQIAIAASAERTHDLVNFTSGYLK